MLRRFSVNFALFSMVLDAACVAIMLHATTLLRPALNALPGIAPIASPFQLPTTLYILFPLTWVAIFGSFALYDGKRYIRVVDEFAVLSLASILAGVSLAGILYFLFRDFSRAQYLLFVLLSYGAFALWRAGRRVLFRLRRSGSSDAVRRVLIVGTGPIARMIETRLLDANELDLIPLGFVDDAPPESFVGPLLGALGELSAQVSRLEVTDVIIALPPHFYEQIKTAVSSLNEIPVRVWIALGFFDLALYRTVTEDLGGLPLLDLRASALDDYERTIKRGFDLVVGTLALVGAIPVLVVAAILILLDDGGPFLFVQKRVGENGHLFDLYKLRTMVREAERLSGAVETRDAGGHLVHKSRSDPRVTRVGRFLRRLSVDELPQIINVLKGDMSLVGPRPELPQVVQEYELWQRQRLAVPPGITGWWQVTGRSEKLMHLHTEDDLYYVRNYSIWLDMQILMRTVWVVILGRGAY
jgi:exopolysaccharide biosynthesis polyprenyl glycosylphosphotransferase